MNRRLLWIPFFAVLVACEPPLPDAPALQAPIVDGTRELGELAVVTVTTFGGMGLCTGTLIAPNVVLTAKHCVQGSGADRPYPITAFGVGVGDRLGSTRDYRVRYVETTPGVYVSDPRTGLRGEIFGVDVAVLILREAVPDVAPIPIRRDRPDDMIGQEFTAIGFGQRPDGGSGLKYKGGGVLVSIADSVLYTAETICSGDSGGPMIQESPERVVIGVASFGVAESCPSSQDGYNALYEHTDLIDRAFILAGLCIDLGEELCDSLDNDCDGDIDEGCEPVGGPCETDADCAFAELPDFLPPLANPVRCEDVGTGPVCTRACDPLTPTEGCSIVEHFGRDTTSTLDGLYCQRTDNCEGRCMAGTAGARADGERCTESAECASLACADPGDGARRCLPPCRSGQGSCPVGEACAAPLDACSYCVDAAALVASRQIGEPCDADGQCAGGGTCRSDPAGAYCTRACGRDDECPSAFRCNDAQCERGSRAGTGEPCAGNGDCAAGHFCAEQGSRAWCTRFCADAACPEGLDCVSVGGAQICVPDGALLGDACEGNADCVGGLCEDGRCVRACSATETCPAGFACRRDAAGRARCLPPPPPSGCSVGSPRASHVPSALALLALAWLLARRRR